jgi:hypothetical protein
MLRDKIEKKNQKEFNWKKIKLEDGIFFKKKNLILSLNRT